jgi:DNA primase
MIKQESIEELRDRIEILDVIENKYDIALKKRGSVHVGCCPFHNEKSPSFTVSESKGIFKCFGCGVGGDAFKFVSLKDGLEFIPAVRELAEWKNFDLQEEEQSEEDRELAKTKADLRKINKAAAKWYMSHLEDQPIYSPVKQEIYKNRQLHYDTLQTFEVGFAPDQWQFITPTIIDKGLYYPAVELGLVATSNERNYDVYRNRIIFPIHDAKGDIIAFGGRKLEKEIAPGAADPDKDVAKYINGKDSPLYKKDRALYGIFQAQKAIREMGFAVVVEGYYDVLSCHQNGLPNTVASCGTAFTTSQAQLLKRFTNVALLFFDGDAAGNKALMKTIDILLKEGFKVETCLLKEDEDPDSFARLHQMPLEPILDSTN